jgi:hypothetical protein
LFPSFDDFVGDGVDGGEAGLSNESSAGDAGDGNASTCDASLATDPLNCGACGRDCRGGACEAGTCLPYTFASVAYPAGLAAVETGVYATSRSVDGRAGGNIVFVPSSGATMTLASPPNVNDPKGVIVAGGRLYWANEGTRGANLTHAPASGSIGTCNLDGSDARLFATNLDDPYGLAWDGQDALFFTTRGKSCDMTKCTQADGAVLTCSLENGCGAAPTPVATGEIGPMRVAFGNKSLYWTVDPGANNYDGPVRTIAISGGGSMASTIPGTMTAGVYGFALDPSASSIYAATVTSTKPLIRVPLGSGAATTFQLPRLLQPFGVVVDDRFVYVLDFTVMAGTGGLYRVDKVTSSATLLEGGQAGDSLAMSSKYVFYTHTAMDGSGVIRSVTK